MATELEQHYHTYKKRTGHVHLSRTGYFKTLCALNMDMENMVFGKNIDADCPICLKEYKERTGKDADKQKPIENQISLF